MTQAYNLLIDIGNTFVKWGRYSMADAAAIASHAHQPDTHELESGRALQEEIPSLFRLFRRHETPQQVVISNVAGTRARAMILRALEAWPEAPQPHWLTSQAVQCGVTNGYRNPGQLGTDRWASLIAARALYPGDAVFVVTCGTATTMDLLSAQSATEGRFEGGCILPGLGLMIRSLHEGTAALPDADGDYADHPTQTVDAIVSGCQHAQAGAIERLFLRHQLKHPALRLVLSGGAAKTLAPRVAVPFTARDNMVLEGLYQVAQSLNLGK